VDFSNFKIVWLMQPQCRKTAIRGLQTIVCKPLTTNLN